MPDEISEQIRDAIRRVDDQTSFVNVLLRQTLHWPLELDFGLEIQDIAYEYPEFEDEVLSRELLATPVLQLPDLEGNTQQPWGIFILQFASALPFTSGRGLTGPLRRLLRKLIRAQANRRGWDRPNLLFICTHEYRHFRFAYFKSAKEAGHAEPLAMFGWEPGVPPRTVCNYNLKYLEWPDDPADSDVWIAKWAKAFDIETVTQKFYDAYEKVFTDLQTQLNLPSDEDKKMFAQILMNRLMFLRFVERKGWLKLGDSNPKEYLKTLYQAGRLNNLSWYRSRLQVLFFEGLAVPNHNKEDVIGSVPYLNGGLFTITEWDERAGDIADEVFEPILGEEGLLYRYNFTVEESTPFDIEVAVDPEMLGKVFEKLVTARRQQGSYYTPRTVVSFMCRESLKGYLGSGWASLIDEHKIDDISVPQATDLLAKLAELKVVDPACGSGAYLLGMLHELYTITELLDSRAEQATAHDAYQRKLQIIQNNIYGVDLDEFAVNIARLRLWLSLAVEFKDDQPDPLPNLDYKIETGDSLISHDPSGGFPATFDDIARTDKINEYDRLKAIHMDPQLRSENPGIEDRIAVLKQEIKEYAHPDETTEGFDWRVEFAEVWSNTKGFDIVIANPPYGIMVDNSVRNQYFNQRNDSEKGQSKDSYGIFLARGLQLLKPNGTLSYIVSYTWRTIKSHRPLRKRLLENTTIFHVLDLPWWIFDARVDTCILSLSKHTPSDDHKLIAGDLSAIENNNWKVLSDNLLAVSGHGPDIQAINCARYTYAQSLIFNYDNMPVFIGSPKMYTLMSDDHFTKVGDIADVKVGLQTGDNEYYLRKREGVRGSYEILNEAELLTDEEIANLSEDEKLNGIDPNRYGGRHYVPYDKGGASNTEEGWLPNYYVPTGYFIDWSQDAVHRLYTATIADVKERRGHQDQIRVSDRTARAAVIRNPDFYFRKGITFSDTGMYSPSFRQNCGSLFDQKGSVIIPNDPEHRDLLLGLLCSVWARYVYKVYVNHTISSHVDSIKEFHCVLNDVILAQIKALVAQIITNQKNNLAYSYQFHEQKQIDSLVYQSYGLDEKDIREIELWYCRRYRILAEAQGVLAEVKDKYADHLARCQRILEKPPSYWRSNPILELIAQGESHTLEFKETLEYCTRQNQQNRNLNKASLKTIAAFLNADGGILLIGVSDSCVVKGIARDLQFVRGNNRDGFEQKLRSLINDHFDPSPLGNVSIIFEELSEGTLCKIDVKPVNRDTIIHFDNDVYIRDGNRTIKLEGRALTDWIQQRTR